MTAYLFEGTLELSHQNQIIKESNMFTQLFRNWWLFVVRGVLAIVFGVLALIWPEPMKFALVISVRGFRPSGRHLCHCHRHHFP